MKTQKTQISFILGVLLGATLFGGTAALAAGILAEPSPQRIFVDGKPAQMTAYAINGNNYVKLRDIGAAVDFNVVYDGDTDSVWIDSANPYVPEQKPAGDINPPQTAIPDGTGGISKTPFSEKVLTGDSRAREDFSQKANPVVFNKVYTREAYNAIYQTMADREIIMQGNNADGFNPNYAYAYTAATAETASASNYVLSRFNAYFSYSTSVEPYLKGYYKYPNYFIITTQHNPNYEIAADAIMDQVGKIKALPTDADKIRMINNIVCDKLTYNAKKSAMPNTIFAAVGVVEGRCTGYTQAVQFLCMLSDIPCVIMSSNIHDWNMVYANGQWLHVDATANDTGDETQARNDALMISDFPSYDKAHNDSQPEATAFVKELLVPGSTK